MHSTLISALALTLVFATAIGLDSSRSVEVFTLAILVALIGVPHGALDHRVGQRLFRPAFGSFWAAAFFSVYLAIAVLVVIGWYVVPATTILTFFLVSAWHFGLEERDVDREVDREVNGEVGVEVNGEGWIRHLLAIASGGMIIWMPALCRGDEVAELLTLITPSDQDSMIAFCVSTVATSAVIFTPLWVFDCIQKDLQHGRPERGWVGRVCASKCLRMLSFALLCYVANPLVSFMVYFCGWHSIRGLHQLAQALGESIFATYRKLLPLTVAALGLVTAVAYIWSSTAAIESSAVRTVFIGLSAMAVPHLCLHVAAGEVSQRFINPSAAKVEVFNRA